MGEFVGIDPPGAQRLIRQMEIGKSVLGGTRPGLDAAIAEAGADWAGRQGTTAMHRTWAFFHEAQQDLKWRIDTVEQLVPVREKGMLTGMFPFRGAAAATRAAEQAAGLIAAALARHDEDPSWRGVERAVSSAEDEVHDPAYAAALLAALGPETFTRLFGDWIRAAGEPGGLPPEAMDRAAGSSPGVLAQAFASAERTGRLGEEWYAIVETAPADVLTTLVGLAGQSSTLLNRVAAGVLSRPPGPGWNPYNLARAYEANPEAFQHLLAEHEHEARALFAAFGPATDASGPAFDIPGPATDASGPAFDASGPGSAYEEALARALHAALRPDAGVAGLRQRAWINVIRGMGSRAGDDLGAFAGSPVSRALVGDVPPYLGQLARVQAEAPEPPWDKLDPETAARFMGALMRDPAAAATLMTAYAEWSDDEPAEHVAALRRALERRGG
ncbi:hypothetical protein ITP53_35895 [Nonomuraea sp. K274]|uniref:Uncharacterized protein n=1 Tax=Nonomuraea cypriaca TaxID=1187855 RepID=A0A931F1Y8_9ACTN|nr:hypothetical protein [Nonomuraea cypriaca]MBF8191000.1 hypothetical protein [Nonomuraea cypriaca]